MYKCKICGKEYDRFDQLGGHMSYHNESLIKSRYKPRKRHIHVKKKCRYCKKSLYVDRTVNKDGTHHISKKEKIYCTRSCANRDRIVSSVTKEKIRQKVTGKVYSHKKEIFRCKNCHKIISGRGETGLCVICVCKSLKFKKRQSNNMKRLYREGRQQTGGRTKWYTIDSPIGKVKVQGSYELIFCNWMNLHNLDWRKNLKRFNYTDRYDKVRSYLPDFWINDFQCFVEVKGRWTESSIDKKRQFKLPIVYIEYEQIEAIKNCKFSIDDFHKLDINGSCRQTVKSFGCGPKIWEFKSPQLPIQKTHLL